VVKFFRDQPVFEAAYFAQDLAIVDKTIGIVTQWNEMNIINGAMLSVNKPTVWTSEDGRDEKMLLEPYIEGWTKFNSNTG
jgi:hypothetical protein